MRRRSVSVKVRRGVELERMERFETAEMGADSDAVDDDTFVTVDEGGVGRIGVAKLERPVKVLGQGGTTSGRKACIGRKGG